MGSSKHQSDVPIFRCLDVLMFQFSDQNVEQLSELGRPHFDFSDSGILTPTFNNVRIVEEVCKSSGDNFFIPKLT